MKKRLLSLALAVTLCIGLFAAVPPPAQASGNLNLPLSITPTTISTGGADMSGHNMAIKNDGSLWAWGNNFHGQIGDGTNQNERRNPVKIMDGVKSVYANNFSSFAIKDDNSLWAWGENNLGQLGDGTTENRSSPVKIADNVAFVTGVSSPVSTTLCQFAIIKTDGSLWTWGTITFDGTTEARLTPNKIKENVVWINMNGWIFCVLTSDGTLWVGGSNSRGQLGNGTFDGNTNELVKVMDGVVTVSATRTNVAAIRFDGSFWGWGGQINVQREGYTLIGRELGVDKYATARPYKIADGVRFVYAADILDVHEYLYVKTDGSLWHLGANAMTSVKIMDSVSSVTQSRGAFNAIKTNGELWAWGNGEEGILGDGAIARRTDPVKILDDAAVLSMNFRASMAIKKDGSLWAWGAFSFGGFGDGSLDKLQLTPAKVIDGVKLPIAPPAPDVPSSWATEQVNTAITAGLVPQSLQSKYTQATTRAEFAALAVAVYESVKGEITGRVTFTDTNDVNVQKMAYLEVVGGVGGNRFDPNGTLTREQAAVMASRLSDAIGQPFPAQASTFADNGAASSWALEGIGRVQAAELMGGTGDNNFSPQAPYTREQSIITFLRFFEMVK